MLVGVAQVIYSYVVVSRHLAGKGAGIVAEEQQQAQGGNRDEDKGSVARARELRTSSHGGAAASLAARTFVVAAESVGEYAALLFDFKYFKSPKLFKEQIEANSTLAILDDEFREECSSVVEHCFWLFDGIVKYYKDLSRFTDDLLQVRAGAFLQESAESVLEDKEGQQLLVEALVLHRVLLLLLEHRMTESLREQLLVAHCWCRGFSDFVNFEAIQSLCRFVSLPPKASSAFASVALLASLLQGSSPSSASEPNMIMPLNSEEMCNRFLLPKRLLRLAIARLRTDGIYNQLHHYPNLEHYCVALGGQAACLYILLNFIPEILQNESSNKRHCGQVFARMVDRSNLHGSHGGSIGRVGAVQSCPSCPNLDTRIASSKRVCTYLWHLSS